MTSEALGALIGAYEPGPGGLRALLPLAGATLMEQQARRAAAAGAERIVLLVDEVPAELSAALVRLRAEGLAATFAQGIDIAADMLAGMRVLLLADGCLVEPPLLRALSDRSVPAVATVADGPDRERYERIDADERWAGAALIDGHRVAETAAMLGSWDPVSTLLRRAVQEGAERVVADADPPLLLVDRASVSAAETAIVAAARRHARDWPDRFLFAPLEEWSLPLLLAKRVQALPVTMASALLAWAGAGAAWLAWPWAALLLVLLSGPVAAAAARLSRVQARQSRWAVPLARMRVAGAVLGLAGLANMLAASSGQWGWWLLGGLTAATMLLLQDLRRRSASGDGNWVASVDALAWMLLPFALVGRWDLGVAAAAAYSTLSFAGLYRTVFGARED